MDYSVNYGDKTAQRLRELREEKGYSHSALAEEFNKRYKGLTYTDRDGKRCEIKLSESALKSFEVGDKPHSKRLAGDGMGIRYLRCLADFYGVSADYLLGITEIKSPSPDLRAICEYTGLSEAAVGTLRYLNESSKHDFWSNSLYTPISFVNELLSRPVHPRSWLLQMITSFCVACQHRFPHKKDLDHISSLASFDYSVLPEGFTVVERREYSDFGIYETERNFSKIIRDMAKVAEQQLQSNAEAQHGINET